MISRRNLLQAAAGAAVMGILDRQASAEPTATAPSTSSAQPPIDRQALVRRHNVIRKASKSGSPLQVGNGNFAFGADITGLQTFIAFNTMSQWGWYSYPLPAGQTLSDMRDPLWDSHGRPVPYETGDPDHPQITAWAFSNPTRINLARIGLTLLKADGAEAIESDLTDAHQELDLWTGTLVSRFKLDGVDVTVRTAGHPHHDSVAVSIASSLLIAGRLGAFINFPAPDERQFAGSVGSFDDSSSHRTTDVHQPDGRTDITCDLGTDQKYHASVTLTGKAVLAGPGATGKHRPVLKILEARYGAKDHWFDAAANLSAAIKEDRLRFTATNDAFGGDPALKEHKRLEVSYSLDDRSHKTHVEENGTLSIGAPDPTHRFSITPGQGSDTLEFVVAFSSLPIAEVQHDTAATFTICESHWPKFWNHGGAIDLSGSKDPRWMELERRIVLSQYLMAVNEAGDLPPQESGLVNTGWFGKFHMEMYLWHAAHYALWNRWVALDRSLGIYQTFLPSSQERAKKQGYRGARWTKMTGPDGRNSAYITNAMLIWQQPHPMFFAELDYRAHPTRETLEKWQTILSETGEFMASYATWDDKTHRFVLGPPMAVVSENTEDKITVNPTFELSYWRFGLRIAQTWRERLGQPRDANWDHVLAGLSPLPVEDGVYTTYEGIEDMWTKHNFEHPGLIGVFGLLPGDGVDMTIMHATADRVFSKWQFNRVWGWDWPMLAMCAARLGDPNRAVDLLLTKYAPFQFDDAGLATGGPWPYFPSNGGLLYAVALMAAGWDKNPDARTAPGFPDPTKDGGQWIVRSEGLSVAI